MLSSIHPLGERGKGNRFGVTATAFVVGAVLGGVTTGVLSGAVGQLVGGLIDDRVALTLVGAVALGAAVSERSGRWLPSVPRQVNEDWLTEYRGWVYGAGFGFQLGAGVLTFITSAAVYVALAAMVLAGDLAAGALIGGVFGLTRGLSLVPARRINSPGDLVMFHRRLQGSAATVRLVSTSVLAGTALVAAAAVIQELP